jgi:rhodanese-related sulfurtransferase
LRLAEVNRRGPALLDAAPKLAPLTPQQAQRTLAAGSVLVDVRRIDEFAAGHVPGSLSIELRDVFATWLGWVAPHDRPLLVLRGPDQDPDEIGWQAAKVGYDFAGELAGGIDAWAAAGLPITSTRIVGVDEVDRQQVLDVRQRSEFAGGHLPGARNVELGDVPTSADDLTAGRTVVMCGHGERAMTGASLLERAGHRDVSVLVGGPEDWAGAHGVALETRA